MTERFRKGAITSSSVVIIDTETGAWASFGSDSFSIQRRDEDIADLNSGKRTVDELFWTYGADEPTIAEQGTVLLGVVTPVDTTDNPYEQDLVEQGSLEDVEPTKHPEYEPEKIDLHLVIDPNRAGEKRRTAREMLERVDELGNDIEWYGAGEVAEYLERDEDVLDAVYAIFLRLKNDRMFDGYALPFDLQTELEEALKPVLDEDGNRI